MHDAARPPSPGSPLFASCCCKFQRGSRRRGSWAAPSWVAAALVLASTTSMFCRTDSDCSLNGLCTAGICACDAPWAGNRCQTLQLAVGLLGLHDIPLCAYHGDGPNSTSWGALHARSMYTACMQAVRCCVHALCALHVRCMRTACKWYSCAPPIRSCSCACRRFGAACAGGRQVLHVGSLDD